MILILFISPIYIFSQQNEQLNNSIGVGLNWSTYSQLNGELKYERFITTKSKIAVTLNHSFNHYFKLGLRLGYRYKLLQLSRFNFWLGADLSVQNDKQTAEIEIPLEFRYSISNRFQLLLGLSPVWFEIVNHRSYGLNQFPDNLRISILYNY